MNDPVLFHNLYLLFILLSWPNTWHNNLSERRFHLAPGLKGKGAMSYVAVAHIRVSQGAEKPHQGFPSSLSHSDGATYLQMELGHQLQPQRSVHLLPRLILTGNTFQIATKVQVRLDIP